MDEQTLEALQGSIAQWERRAQGSYIPVTAHNCPLCGLFNTDRPGISNCKGCPVFEETTMQYCEGTPCEMYYADDSGSVLQKRRAAEEVEFLKSLLPSESIKDANYG